MCPTLAVLAYHKVGEPAPGGWETWFYVPEEVFAAQLAVLEDDGWEVVDLDSALRALDEPEVLPPRAVLLTFDDGCRSTRTVALPLLEARRWPAVAFLPTDFVGGVSSFDPDEPREPICSWDDLRALERGGVSVQSHGASHRRFSELDDSEVAHELARSGAALEAGLGRPRQALAYPYGDPGAPRVAPALARAGYRAAFAYKGGPIGFPADRYRLARVPMGPDTDLPAVLGRV